MFVVNTPHVTLANDAYRRVIFTTTTIQMVVMCLAPHQDIPKEQHKLSTQILRVEHGDCAVELFAKNGFAKKRVILRVGDSVIIPPGKFHRVIAGTNGVRLSTLYSPPQHDANLIQQTQTTD